MIWLDIEYLGHLRSRLDRFKVKTNNPYTANFRCPLCGDSKKSKTKARGYIFTKPGGLFYKCHNCQASMSLGKLIEQLDGELFKRYNMEKYKAKQSNNSTSNTALDKDKQYSLRMKLENKSAISQMIETNRNAEEGGRLLDSLMDRIDILARHVIEDHDMADYYGQPQKETHPALQYMLDRQIPEPRWSDLYYIAHIGDIVQLNAKYRGKITGKEPRIVIPYYNRQCKLIGVSCRAINDQGLRYVNVTIDEDAPWIFNIENTDLFNEEILVVEGPFDSMFLPNCVAAGTSDLDKVRRHLMSYPHGSFSMTLIFDNQPRNSEIINLMKKNAEIGHKIVVWPEHVMAKDINEMVVQEKRTVSQIMDIINNNTFKGLALQAAINNWKKI